MHRYFITIRGNDEYEYSLTAEHPDFNSVVFHCNARLLPTLSEQTIEQLRITEITELS